MSTDILRCPFCGAKPFENYASEERFFVGCVSILCAVNPSVTHVPPRGTSASARGAWNRRFAEAAKLTAAAQVVRDEPTRSNNAEAHYTIDDIENACCEAGVTRTQCDGICSSLATAYPRSRLASPHPEVSERERALADIAAERQRQISVKGWTPEHDDEHTDCSLSDAAATYAMGDSLSARDRWPSGWGMPRFKDRRTDLVRSAALIVAEIERIDRAALAPRAAAPHTADETRVDGGAT